MRKRIVLVVVLVVAGMSAGLPAGGAATSATSGSFGVVCTFTHRLRDDPIVFPGVPGASHWHDFFGNTSTNAATTAASLLAKPATTCNRPSDHSGYWAPTVYYNGTPVTPSKVQLYYNNNHRANLSPPPPGLQIVAGNAKATGPQDTRQLGWSCSDNLGAQPVVAMPPVCPTGTTLKMVVRFPGCWDGKHLTSADHKSHMAYASGNQHDGPCPAGYPVPVVTVNVEFKYPIRGGSTVTLSSGRAYTLHADFFNGWDAASLKTLVTKCVNAGVQCTGQQP